MKTVTKVFEVFPLPNERELLLAEVSSDVSRGYSNGRHHACASLTITMPSHLANTSPESARRLAHTILFEADLADKKVLLIEEQIRKENSK